jgi:hypothetical protein
MNHLETLNEYIDSHFSGNKTEKEARLAFQTYRDDVLASVPSMDAEFIREQPACVAMGFLGKMDFVEGASLEKFVAMPSLETLAVLRKNAVVRVAESAREAWKYLVVTDENAACLVLGLCASTRKDRRVSSIKSPKATVSKPTISLKS